MIDEKGHYLDGTASLKVAGARIMENKLRLGKEFQAVSVFFFLFAFPDAAP